MGVKFMIDQIKFSKALAYLEQGKHFGKVVLNL